jgi:hypothetical protein
MLDLRPVITAEERLENQLKAEQFVKSLNIRAFLVWVFILLPLIELLYLFLKQ